MYGTAWICVSVIGNPGSVFQKRRAGRDLGFSCSKRLGGAVSSRAWVGLTVIAVPVWTKPRQSGSGRDQGFDHNECHRRRISKSAS